MEVTQKNLLVDTGAKLVRVKWYTSGGSRGSLRSKRFQSSYCAKVRAEAIPLPRHFFFFCSRPDVLDELARKRLLRRLLKGKTECYKNEY